MSYFINVRGCNGSGKTTVVRSLLAAALDVKVESFDVPSHKPIPVTVATLKAPPAVCRNVKIAIIGDYTKDGCTGLDRIKTQAASKYVIEKAADIPDVEVVVFEGVLVSTIYGPWLEWSRKMGSRMLWAFLDTPIEECLARIQNRNGGKPIKEEQVRAKHLTISRVQDKARAAGQRVVVLPWRSPSIALYNEVMDCRNY
jgi:predicted ABC-type ATPase